MEQLYEGGEGGVCIPGPHCPSRQSRSMRDEEEKRKRKGELEEK